MADLVGIEAVRVLHPALFEAIVSVAGYLSAPTALDDQGGYQRDRSAANSPIAPMYAVAPGLAEDVCRWLFPGARRYFENTHYGSEWEIRWRRQRKVASSTIFRFYLERQLPEGVVPSRAVDEALSHLTNRGELQQLLDTWSPDELMDLLERMNPAIEELPVNATIEGDPARIALPVLLDLLPRLPEDRGVFRPSGPMTLMRVALRLVRRIPDEAARADLVRAVLKDTRTFSSRLILLWVVGPGKTSGTALSPRPPRPNSRITCAPISWRGHPVTSRCRPESLGSPTSWPRPTTERLRCRPWPKTIGSRSPFSLIPLGRRMARHWVPPRSR